MGKRRVEAASDFSFISPFIDHSSILHRPSSIRPSSFNVDTTGKVDLKSFSSPILIKKDTSNTYIPNAIPFV